MPKIPATSPLPRSCIHERRPPKGPRLGLGQPLGDMHRRGFEPELARGFQPRVPGQHNHRFIDNDRLAPAKFLDRSRNRGDGLSVAPRVARIGNDLLKRQFQNVHGDVLGKAPKRNGSGQRNEMGSDPRFVSGAVCQAARPMFHWGCVQSETKRVFFRVSLGKRGTQPPRIRLQTGGTRSISIGYMSHKIDQRQFFCKTGHRLHLHKPVRTNPRSRTHDGHLIGFIASRSRSVTACGVSPKSVSLDRKGLTRRTRRDRPSVHMV